MNVRVAPLRVVGLLMVVAVNAWLLNVVAGHILFDDPVNLEKTDWRPSLSVSTGGISGRKTLDAYQDILTRPVFFKSREPFVPVPPAPPPTVMALPPPIAVDPGLVLGGVMIKNGMKKAYVLSRANTSGAWANEGDEFLGWQIRSINGAGARLEQGGRSIELKLYPRE